MSGVGNNKRSSFAGLLLLAIGLISGLYLTQQSQDIRKLAYIPQPPTPTPTPSSCIPNGSCYRPGETCCGGYHYDIACSPTETRCGSPPATPTPTPKPPAPTKPPNTPTPKPPTPTPTKPPNTPTPKPPTPTSPPSCTPNGYCLALGSNCCSGYGYYDGSCSGVIRCWSSPPTPTPTKPPNTPTPTKTPNTPTPKPPAPTSPPSCTPNGYCLASGSNCCSGYVRFSSSCSFYSICDNPPATPTPQSATPTVNPEFDNKGDLDNDGDVDYADYIFFAESDQYGNNGNPGFTSEDINDDGTVDIFDFNIVITNISG